MEIPVIFTDDSIGVGEDGPTHQPVEHLASLRAIPGLVTIRPGDANEVGEAYRAVMQMRHRPAVLALSRQPLPTLDRTKYASASGVARGAYVLAEASGGRPEVIPIASKGPRLPLHCRHRDPLTARQNCRDVGIGTFHACWPFDDVRSQTRGAANLPSAPILPLCGTAVARSKEHRLRNEEA